RLDGRGYPDHLVGEQISIEARLLAIADSFDAMTSARAYRPAAPVAEALAELKRCRGTQFDPAFVDLFVRLIEEEGEVLMIRQRVAQAKVAPALP
ncbi:MAG: HD domain-containing phosphohydrolase, partial [Alphaproteobacteria bacterium]|nr:HD domain-containing phosphohydrolase [Alphaproteobacteria bacterium]